MTEELKCAYCGRTEKETLESKPSNAYKNIIEHHLDYEKKITIPLCFSSHQKWHTKNKPIGTRKEMLKREQGNKEYMRTINKKTKGWYNRL